MDTKLLESWAANKKQITISELEARLISECLSAGIELLNSTGGTDPKLFEAETLIKTGYSSIIQKLVTEFNITLTPHAPAP